MNLKTKIAIVGIAILLISLFGFIIYTQHEISKKQDAINTQMIAMKQLPDGTSRGQTNWATKDDLDALGKQNGVDMQAIRDDLKTFKADLTAVNVVSVKSTAQVGNNIASTSTTPN